MTIVMSFLGLALFYIFSPNSAMPFAILCGACIIGEAIKENKER